MGKKNHQKQHHPQRSKWIPPVGNGGIKKKNHNQLPPPSFIVPGYPPPPPQPNQYQIPGYPILPFAVRLVTDRSTSTAPPAHPRPPPPFPPPSHFPHFLHPNNANNLSSLPFIFPPPSAPSVVVLPPPAVPPLNAVNKTPRKMPKKKRISASANAAVDVADQRQPQGVDGDICTKKAQMKYAKQMASRANKRKSSVAAVQPVVKTESGVGNFNLFMNIAQRYRSKQKCPNTIEIADETEEHDEVEEVEQEENDAPANNTIFGDMSICTVDEVGEQTMVDDGEGRGRRIVERNEIEEGEIEISSEDEEEYDGDEEEKEEEEEEEGGEEEEEIVCLGEQKTQHVMSEVVVLEDDDDEGLEVEEVDVANETMIMDRAFSEKRRERKSVPPMEESIIDLSLDDGNEGETAATVSELPDFIPLIDAEKKKKKRGKGKQQQSPFVQPIGTAVQQRNGGTQQTGPSSSSSFPWSPSLVVMTRPKSTRERKREMYRKRAETRAMDLGASPASVAKAVAASTCSFPLAPTPSKIPLPNAPAPPTPCAHLFRFTPAPFVPSSSFSSFPSSAMGLIQSRGLSTSAPQSQPVDFGAIGMSHSSSHTTLAAVLQDEASGVVRDSLTASGIYPRRWEEKWMSTSDSLSRDVKVDPSAAPFRVCTYNVLCQKTISSTSYLYRHLKLKQHVLEWSYRWPLIQRELSELNADIFGLQEIQDVHFEEYYEPYMKSLGYSCFFQPKSQTTHSDGLGVFVRANRFKISSMNSVDFLIPGDNLMDRGNVAQVLRVECLQTGAPLIITNTHILFNEKRGDIKLAQIALLMANIHAIRQEDEPVVCLGDWNLEPASDLYNYITGGSLDASQFVPRYGSGQLREGRNIMSSPMRELPMDTHLKTRMSRDGILYHNEGALLQSLQRSHPSTFSHQIPLTSTYGPYRERQVSTFHKDTANPDFIFYSTAGRGESESRRLRLIRRLAVPPEENIRSTMEPWPNHAIPSDHIPLLAEFYLSK